MSDRNWATGRSIYRTAGDEIGGQNDRHVWTTAQPTFIVDLRRPFLGVNKLPNDYNHRIDRTSRIVSFLYMSIPNITLLSDWNDS